MHGLYFRSHYITQILTPIAIQSSFLHEHKTSLYVSQHVCLSLFLYLDVCNSISSISIFDESECPLRPEISRSGICHIEASLPHSKENKKSFSASQIGSQVIGKDTYHWPGSTKIVFQCNAIL